MANATIGMVKCPLSGELAAVRRDRSGRLYYISIAGKISPSGDYGQEWFLEHATIWGVEGTPPESAPDWIVQGKSYPPASASRRRGDRQPNPATVKPAAPQPHSTPASKDVTGPAPAAAAPARGNDVPPPRPARARNPFSLISFEDD